ncbi:hypothetical protein KC316_g6661 [Hortaea werneckii]|uniref:Enoyl reductase (ER) domain-containing protein n=1 Tax=Hortaea werneckii TaxID=91943 RepID=A0A3M6Y563_HORWE|nr:hypothetical protein KC324_g5653 [Hortaea werneckii]KAI7584510.1 hypothetical protein KC316_g6661 [Hortaea werneckii]RMX98172.1 hypothetical protein D0868_10240 [Hortaea werneckii]
MDATASNVTSRQAYRRTDDFTVGTPQIKLVTEPLPPSLQATEVLVKVHAVALNYRDANIAHGGNPWPVTPHGIICNDAAGEVIAAGQQVKTLRIGDRVAPNTDTANLTGRTGGVSMFALKLARAMGLRIILTSSSDEKLKQISEKFATEGTSQIDLVNYSQNPDWHEEVLRHTEGEGVDVVLENGGPGTLLKSMKCTRRGGIVSQVGYLDRKRFDDAPEVLPLLIDRRIVLRGINAGSKSDLDDLCRALTATRIRLDDIIDSVWSFEKAEEALQYLWEGKQIGKLVIEI